jgi:hypothetical protein
MRRTLQVHFLLQRRASPANQMRAHHAKRAGTLRHHDAKGLLPLFAEEWRHTKDAVSPRNHVSDMDSHPRAICADDSTGPRKHPDLPWISAKSA